MYCYLYIDADVAALSSSDDGGDLHPPKPHRTSSFGQHAEYFVQLSQSDPNILSKVIECPIKLVDLQIAGTIRYSIDIANVFLSYFS